MRTVTLVIVLSICSLLLGEDVLFLRVGKVVTGKIVDEDDESVEIETKFGRLRYERDEIDSIIYYEEFLRKFEKKLKKAKGDKEKLYELGLWCEKQYQQKEAKECFKAVLELDSNHKGARHRLGYREFGGKWVTEKEYEELMKPREDEERPKKRPRKEADDEDGEEPEEKSDEEPEEPEEKESEEDPSEQFWAKQIVPEDKKERKKWALQRLKNMGWKKLHFSNHYIFFSNITHQGLTEVHATFLDNAYNELCRIFAYKKKQRTLFIVDFYENEEEFAAKEGGGYGFYDGTRVTTYFGITGTQNGTGGIMLRESAYQFMDMVWGDYKRVAEKAGWVVDGIATYMQESRFNLSTGELKVGIVNADRMLEIKGAIQRGRWSTIETVINGGGNLNEKWSLCYFLLHYTQDTRKQFQVFLKALGKKDCNAVEEFRKAFKRYDFNGLYEAWKKYMLELF